MPDAAVRYFESVAEYDAMIDYFLGGDDAFLLSMGVDRPKLPSKEAWRDACLVDEERPDREKERVYVAWLHDGEVVGHSSASHIEFGNTAHVHMHLWRPDLRRSGLGPQFLTQSIALYFDRLSLQTAACEPYAENPGPNRVLQRLGFRFVRRFRTQPTSIALEQDVNRYEIDRERWIELHGALGGAESAT